MAVSYVGVTSGNSVATTSTSFVTTLPAGWAAGDVAILSGHVRGASLTMSTPAGWTLLPGPTWPVDQSTNSRLYAWYRVLQAGDTAPTITNSGAMTGGWSMTVYRGGNTSSPIGQVGTSSVSGTSLTLPTLTGVLAGSALAVATHAGVATGTIPTNITPAAAYTEVVDHATSRATSAANQRMEAAYRLVASAGSYGGEAFTTTVTSSMIAVLAEIKQAAAPAAVAPDGLSVTAAVGAPDVAWSATVAPDGLAVPAAVGDPTAAGPGNGSVAPDGISVPAAVGSPSTVWSASAAPDGLAVPAALGAPTAAWSGTVAPDGISAPVALGDPTTAGSGGVAPDGVPVPVALGAPALAWSGGVAPDGLPVSAALGAPSAAWSGAVSPGGLTVSVALGSPTVSAAPAAVAPDGISVPAAVGSPTVAWSGAIAPDGIPVPVDVGQPAAATLGATVDRPDSGITPPPDTGTTEQPGSGMDLWRGINAAGGEFGSAMPGVYDSDYHYDSAASFAYLASRGHRVVRLPFRWERVQPSRSAPLDATGLQRLRDAVARAYAAGCQVVLDLHNYGRYIESNGTERVLGADLPAADLVDVWDRLSAAFADDPGVLGYGLMNEPHDLAAGAATFTGSTVWDFESGVQSWGGEGSATVARSASRAHGGTYSLAVSNTPTATGQVVVRANDSASNTLTEAGGSTLQAWVYLPADAPGSGHMARLDMQNASYQWVPGPEVALVKGAWTAVQFTPSSALWADHKGIALQIRYQATDLTPLTAYLDDVQQGSLGAGQTAAQRWEATCRDVVAAIRANGDNTTVLVPGYDWSSASRWAHPAPWVDDPNVIYEAHYYFDRDNSGDYPDTYAAEVADAQGRGYANLTARALAEVGVFTAWLAAHDVAGVVGEVGWSNVGDTAGWNATGAAVLSALNAAGTGWMVWATGEWFDTGYPLSVYTGTPLAVPTSVAAAVEPLLGVAGRVLRPTAATTVRPLVGVTARP